VRESPATERNLLRALIDHLPDYVYAKDTEGRFILSNPAHLRVLGAARPEDVLGRTDWDFFPPELAERYQEDEQTVLQQGLPLINREEPVVDAQGGQQWVLTTKVPLKDGQARIVGLVGVTRNVTQLKRAEEQRRLSEARLQAILDNSRAVIYLKDSLGHYILINHRFEQLFHVTRDEVVGKTDLDLFPEAMAQAFRANDLKVLADLAPHEFEEVAPHNGECRIYLSGKFPLLESPGVASAVCGISTDITERKQAEEQLRHAYAELAKSDVKLKQALHELEATHEQLKATQLQLIQAAKLECIGTLAAGVAHEVKNPLQTMLMGLHYLAMNLPDAREAIVQAMNDMRDAVVRANAIVGELLQLSATQGFELKPGDVNGLIDHSLRLINTNLLASRITVERTLAADLPAVPMDRGKLEQVFVNLFINAIHAMPQGGRLSVETRVVPLGPDPAGHDPIFRPFESGTTVVVALVRDTGTGIAEECLPKVFDPFFTTKPVGAGTGLGLAVVKNIVDLHGGAIAIQNGPGGGAVVTLVLNLT
jgi:PAS domain S-box-containing protein